MGHIGGFNLYAYADNDPISVADPSGLKTQKRCDPCKPGPSFSCVECGAKYEVKCNKMPGKKRDSCLAIVNACDVKYCNPPTSQGADFVRCVEIGLKMLNKVRGGK